MGFNAAGYLDQNYTMTFEHLWRQVEQLQFFPEENTSVESILWRKYLNWTLVDRGRSTGDELNSSSSWIAEQLITMLVHLPARSTNFLVSGARLLFCYLPLEPECRWYSNKTCRALFRRKFLGFSSSLCKHCFRCYKQEVTTGKKCFVNMITTPDGYYGEAVLASNYTFLRRF